MRKSSGFQPTKSETKADITNRAAKSIIEAEAAERQSKTERLRTARESARAELQKACQSTAESDSQ